MFSSVDRLTREVTMKSAQEHTDSVEVCAVLDEDLGNLPVPISRCVMKRSLFVCVYRQVENRAVSKIHRGTYR